MKKLVTIYFIIFLIAGLFVPQQIKAQSPPQKMSYQAVIRDGNNVLITSTTVGMKISILQGAAMGGITPVYVETQTPTSNINGLVSLEVGSGTVVSGIFASIDWANGPFYIKTETDPTGGTNYTITGTSQLLSVPYALHAKTAETVIGTITEIDPVFTAWNRSTGISITESQISDLNHFTTADEIDPSVPTGTVSGQMQYWNGVAWVVIAPGTNGQTLTNCYGTPTWGGTCTPPAIGDNLQGGIVFYILQSGDPGYVSGETHGLIVVPTTFAYASAWGCNSTTISGADGTVLGSGSQNTIDILNGCTQAGTAAKQCADLVLNGYEDWYLPSKDELYQLYLNRGVAGNFSNHTYWSSSEKTLTPPLYAVAWAVNFSSGAVESWTKNSNNYVRAIRSF